MLRELAWRVAPAVLAERAARFQRSQRAEWGLPQKADWFISEHGDRVLRGPFAGMVYWRGGDTAVAKMVGSYELEIASWFAEAMTNPPAVFVDLGAADGFYAIGMKVACPTVDVVAFELSATARDELLRMESLNGVTVSIRRRASARALELLRLTEALVLCDIEGAEADVLTVKPLRNSTMIVELHERERPGVTGLLLARFSKTHTVELLHSRPRTLSDFPEAIGFADALEEFRGGAMSWARFTPRSE